MKDFLENIKRDLNETSSEHATITLSRKDVEKLVSSYEKKTELLIEKIADERKEVLKKLGKSMKDKKPLIIKDGIIQEDLDNPDYLYLLEDDWKGAILMVKNEDEQLYEITKERIKNDNNKRLTFEELLVKVPKLKETLETLKNNEFEITDEELFEKDDWSCRPIIFFVFLQGYENG